MPPFVDVPVVVASNRGPLSFRISEHGQLERAGTGGGLAGTLHPLLSDTGATWISVAMSEADRKATKQGAMAEEGLNLVTLLPDEGVYRKAYDVISNATLWFVLHALFDLPRRPRYDRRWHEAWEGYRALNQMFAQAVIDCAPESAVVLIQDYHLFLTGRTIADARPDLRTVHFTHAPFCSPDGLRTLPTAVSNELLLAMAGFGACGFHTRRWEEAFRSCFVHEDPRGASPAKPPPSFTSPLGPDAKALMAEAETPACESARSELMERRGDRKLIVRVDRMELSKNLLRGFFALDELLEQHREWRARVTMLALAYPSRESVIDYVAYRSEIENVVERVNERWGTDEWEPIILDVADNRARSMAALRSYDVLLINPVRDGLNLIAKEGPIVNQNEGVVVLSREAGAWEELHDDVIGINPFDVTETAEALHQALVMDSTERRSKAQQLRARALSRSAADWLGEQIRAAPQAAHPKSPGSA